MRFWDFRASAAPAASGRHDCSGWFDGLRCSDFCHTHEVARGSKELRHEVGAFDATPARLAEVAGGLHPAKRFLDAFADSLAGFVGLRPGGASVKSGGLPALDAGHMRGDLAVMAILHKLLGVIAFVRSDASDLKAKHRQFVELLRGHIRLGVSLAARRLDVQFDQQAIAILAHRMHPKT